MPIVPQELRAAAKRIASETVRRHAVDPSAAIAFLRPVQRRQTEELSAMLGRNFPEWMTLWGGSAV
jgi:hypothetical protein